MKAYAAWLAIQESWPKSIERLKQLGAFVNTKCSRPNLTRLERREDFIALVQTYRDQEVTRTKGIIERHLEQGVKAHMRGLEMALAESDHRAIPKFTTPLIERAWPKQNEQQQAVPLIEIHLGQGQTMRLLNQPVADVVEDADYEVVTDE